MSDHVLLRQALQTIVHIGAVMVVCILLSGCGKKPGHVDPPLGAEKSGFPYTYPDPQADPAGDVDADPTVPVRTAPRIKNPQQ